MEVKVSSLKPVISSSDYASDPDEKEISEGEDEDDDRNHKHRKREDARSQSLEGNSLDQGLTRPYRKRNRLFEDGYSYREGDPQSGGTWNNHNIASERDYSSRFGKRHANQASYSRGPLDLNPRIRGNFPLSGEAGPFRGRGRGPVSWGPRDSRFGLVDVAFAGRGMQNVPNAQSMPWNAFGLIPGVPSGGLDALHPLSLQGALRPVINPPMNIGIPRQRCRDFEERGFCLRGDMCPMEHGLNRIVIDDVQSLSQFNLPVSLPGSQLMGTSSGQGALPVISNASGSLMHSPFHAKSGNSVIIEGGSGLNGVVGGPMAGASDVYDPDQPLWTSDNPETSAALLALNQSNAGKTESFLDMDPSDPQNVESYEGLDDDRPVSGGAAGGSQKSSVWGKISSSKHRSGQKEKIDSVGTSSSYLDQDIKSEAPNIGLPDVSVQGKLVNGDGNGPIVKELSFKPRSESVHNIRKPSHKALRTLFVNGIPLKDNKRENLISHFQKFGEVIDIHIPMNGERAFVQFSKRAEAEAALTAPDAVMGNRFIKLWWANRDNIADNGISGTSNMPITPQRMTLNPAVSRSFVNKGKEDPQSAGGKDGNSHASQVPVHDHTKLGVANGPKPPLLQQKKLERLELLKEELRKKQEMLDQKRNEFRLQLGKLEKQSPGSKDVTVSDLTAKSLKGETSPDLAKAETSKSSPRDKSVKSATSAEHAVTKTSTPKRTVAVQGPLRPSIRPMTSLGSPFSVNRFKLDNRPTAFKIVSSLPAGLANVAALKEHFSSYGDLSSVGLEKSESQEANGASEPSDISALVSFTTRRSAEKAFLYGKCWQGHNLQFMWLKSTNTGKEGGPSVNPPSNMSSDSNIEPSVKAEPTNSEKIGSDKSEHLIGESDAESVKRDEDSKSVSTSVPEEK